MRGKLPPDIDRQLPAFAAFKEERVAPTIIDVISCLTTRRRMHVEDYKQSFLPAPIDYPI